jgi:hypothetical protein
MPPNEEPAPAGDGGGVLGMETAAWTGGALAAIDGADVGTCGGGVIGGVAAAGMYGGGGGGGAAAAGTCGGAGIGAAGATGDGLAAPGAGAAPPQ